MARMTGRQFDRRMSRRGGPGSRPGRSGRHGAAGDARSPQREREIAELAEAVADEHCPALPVDPAAIATRKGITLSFGPYGDGFDGMLEYSSARHALRGLDGGGFHVYANLDRLGRADAPRTRFTLAHELGHYFIDEHRLALQAGRTGPHASLSEYESPVLAEQEADLFAANLLMPRRRFIDAARAAPVGFDGVLTLARRFGTSVTATALRYVDADLRPCAVVKWDRRGYAWKLLSTSAFRARFRRTFQSPADLPPDSPTRRALAGEPVPTPGFFQAGTTAAAWFPGVNCGWAETRDVLFVEQAIPLGRFGVLTMLYPPDPAAGRPSP